MLCTLIPNKRIPLCSRNETSIKEQSWFHSQPRIQFCQKQNPNTKSPVCRYWRRPTPHLINPVKLNPEEIPPQNVNDNGVFEKKNGSLRKGCQQMSVLCGFGYWMNGFRCFHWLGLNFHMAISLSMHPSTLQLVQNIGNLPLVAKPRLDIV